MLPKSLSVSESGRARWLMISITNIRGLSASGTGPAKCLRYGMSPCFRAPIQWYATNTTIAQAAFGVEVAGQPHQPRHQAHEVTDEDEEPEGRDQRQVAPALVDP